MKQSQTRIWGFVVLFGGIVLGVFAIGELKQPSQFQATTRIQLLQSPQLIPVSGSQLDASAEYDSHFIQSQVEVIQSEIVLGRVVEKLDLRTRWSEGQRGGSLLQMDEAIDLLRQSMELSPLQSTPIIEIREISIDAREAAEVANTAAEVYREYFAENQQSPSANEEADNGMTAPRKSLVRILDRAIPPTRPVRPNRPAAGLMLLFSLGISCAGFWLIVRPPVDAGVASEL